MGRDGRRSAGSFGRADHEFDEDRAVALDRDGERRLPRRLEAKRDAALIGVGDRSNLLSVDSEADRGGAHRLDQQLARQSHRDHLGDPLERVAANPIGAGPGMHEASGTEARAIDLPGNRRVWLDDGGRAEFAVAAAATPTPIVVLQEFVELADGVDPHDGVDTTRPPREDVPVRLEGYHCLRRKADDSDRRSATASIARPDRAGKLPVAAPSPHSPSHHSPRDGDEFASIRGRHSHHRTLVRS